MSVISATASENTENQQGRNYTSLSQYIRRKSVVGEPTADNVFGSMIISISDFETRTSLFSKHTR